MRRTSQVVTTIDSGSINGLDDAFALYQGCAFSRLENN
jgi:hypothetical protein